MQRILCFAVAVGLCQAFAPIGVPLSTAKKTPSSQLYAIPALVKKAKLAEIERTEFTEEEMKVYETIQATAGDSSAPTDSPGPLQQSLTRRKGTITIVPEYRRTFTIDRVCPTIDPAMFSSLVREAGATAVSVLAMPPNPTSSAAPNDDLATIREEQRRAKNNVPGSLPVIVNDVILDARQIARAAVAGATAVVLDAQYHDAAALTALVQACRATELECIVTVRSAEHIQVAIDSGATMLKVDGAAVDDPAIVDSIPDGVCRLGTIAVRNDQQLAEIEQAWLLRDQGYHAVWVSEVLYKAGEQPMAIIKAMRSKSSLKWASPTARSGRGEGAREYLGDIMM